MRNNWGEPGVTPYESGIPKADEHKWIKFKSSSNDIVYDKTNIPEFVVRLIGVISITAIAWHVLPNFI